MKKVTKYESTDGKIHNTQTDCLHHETVEKAAEYLINDELISASSAEIRQIVQSLIRGGFISVPFATDEQP